MNPTFIPICNCKKAEQTDVNKRIVPKAFIAGGKFKSVWNDVMPRLKELNAITDEIERVKQNIYMDALFKAIDAFEEE